MQSDLDFWGLGQMAEPEVEFALWADHEAAWEAWAAVATQWRVVAVGGIEGGTLVWLGLDYGSARAALDLAGLAVTPATWAELRCIEAGAIEELNRGR